MVLYPNKLPESERVCSGICNWEKHSFSLPFSAQNDDAVFSLFASHTIPRILITDKEGIIRAVYTDDPLATYQELAKDIDAVLIDKLSGNER